MAWYSEGYPLSKAVEYVNLRHPLLINDLSMQFQLLDRRRIYEILAENGIRTPRHVILNEKDRNSKTVIESDDWVEILGVRFNKPIVEKPVDAEDHNIYIYYPMSAGGGSKRLFRKVADKSSDFYPDVNELRSSGSFIYEEFIETQGVDVKVYTVGPNYGHAEARKSPVIDGKVNRNADGSETRYPVILSSEEKRFANKVCVAFKQGICGFDILRVHGKSYVCDVNGWSFVKTSQKYFDDCAQLLSEIIWTSVRHRGWARVSAVAPLTMKSTMSPLKRAESGDGLLPSVEPLGDADAQGAFRKRHLSDEVKSKTKDSLAATAEDEADKEGASVVSEELRCVICVIRHGDRTPKQKLKFVVDLGEGDDGSGSAGLFAPYFMFFHAFLNADIQAEIIEARRKDTEHGLSDPAVKGGLEAALGIDEPIDTLWPPPGTTAAAVAAVAKAVGAVSNYCFNGNSNKDGKDKGVAKSESTQALEAAAELALFARAEEMAAGNGESISREAGAELLRQARDEMLEMKKEADANFVEDNSTTPPQPSSPLASSTAGALLSLFAPPDDGTSSESSASSVGSLLHPVGKKNSASSQALRHSSSLDDEVTSGSSQESNSETSKKSSPSKQAESLGESKPDDKEVMKDKKDKKDKKNKKGKVDDNAPEKKEIKVKSREGLRSFLNTTEKIRDTLLLLRKRTAQAALAYVDGHSRSSSRSSSEENARAPTQADLNEAAIQPAMGMALGYVESLLYKVQQIVDVLGRGEINGVTRKLQIKAIEWTPVASKGFAGAVVGPKGLVRCTKMQIILKWGGALTPLGEAQAEYLGNHLRKSLYPDPEGGGVLRLHSTFRHDLKIRTSDEGRVMKTAAAFAKGMLQLEGSLTPILVSLVRKTKGSLHMLDHAGNEAVQPDLDRCKLKLNAALQETSLDASRIDGLAGGGPSSVRTALEAMVNPRAKLIKLQLAMAEFVAQLDAIVTSVHEHLVEPPQLYMDETPLLMLDRWRKLHDDFFKPADTTTSSSNGSASPGSEKDRGVPCDSEDDYFANGQFDLTKVPDVLDSIRYDLEHNQRNLPVKPGVMPHLYDLAKDFADSYVAQEYGITRREKLVIGSKMCCELLKKIRNDLILGTEGEGKTEMGDMQYTLDTSHAEYLDVKSVGRRVRTRLYFTSESHLHTLLNVLKYGHLEFAGHGSHSDLSGSSGVRRGMGPMMDEAGVQNMVGIRELCYLTHFVIRVFENLSARKDDPDRFRVELSVSPGASRAPDGDEPSGPLPPTRIASAAAKLAAVLPEVNRESFEYPLSQDEEEEEEQEETGGEGSQRPSSAATNSSDATSSVGAEVQGGSRANSSPPLPRLRGASPPYPPPPSNLQSSLPHFSDASPQVTGAAAGAGANASPPLPTKGKKLASPPSSPANYVKSPSPRGARRTSSRQSTGASNSEAGHPAAVYFENNPDDMV